MKFKLKIIEKNFENYRKELEIFCKKAEKETVLEKTKNNMRYSNWINFPESLLYRIYHSKKYDNGKGAITLLYNEKNDLIAFAGVEKQSKNIAMIIKRYYVLREYRKYHTFVNDFIMPEQIKWSIKKGAKLCIFTINKYQEDTVLYIFKRLQKGKPIISKENILIKKNLLKEMVLLPKRYFINGEKQWIIIYQLENCNRPKVLKEVLIDYE